MIRRATRVILAGVVLTCWAMAQEPGRAPETGQEAEQRDPWIVWKWINFVILVGGLGYLVSKSAPALFAQRKREIEESLLEAARARKDAAARAGQIEARFTGLEREIENLRQTARAETAAEGERLSRETARHLERIRTQSAQEIELMTSGAREDLRKYAGLLALDLAEQRIHSRITRDIQEDLVEGFLQDLRTRVRPGLMARQ